MNLHRIEGKAEWENIPASHRNNWQKVAARTAGVVTIGNFLSVVGLLSIPAGLWLIISGHAFLAGIIILGAGRLCDLLDGWLADKTGTKSPLGEKIDVVFDKISTGVTVLVLASVAILPWLALGLLLLPHIIIAAVGLLAFRRGHKLHASISGKWSMAAAWFCIVAFVAAFGVRQETGTQVFPAQLQVLAAVLLVVSVGLGLIAAIGYVNDYRSNLK
jgi:phosphatidylglycerophosphate synthase